MLALHTSVTCHHDWKTAKDLNDTQGHWCYGDMYMEFEL